MKISKNRAFQLVFALTVLATFGFIPRSENSTKIAVETTNTPLETSEHFVKIALLLDTSNSMDGLINQAKAQLWDIVNEFNYVRCGNETRPSLQIALYEYGNDALSSKEGYVRQVLGFSTDLDRISEKLFSLRTNGGEEFCGQAIHSSLKQLDWGTNPDDLKLIFIAGNEPFTQGRTNYKDATGLAKEKDIVVNTIFCGNYEQGIASQWKNGAVRTGGDYMAIDHNRHIVYVDTPYDAEIIELNERLNTTYLAYGSQGRNQKSRQIAQDNEAYDVEEAIAVKRAVSKSTRLYSNSSWDLVDALEGKTGGISTISKDELPAELKGKSTTEIEKIIEEKRLERRAIQKDIQKLNTAREIYIAKNQSKDEAGLGNVLLEAIKKQAKEKNYHWER